MFGRNQYAVATTRHIWLDRRVVIKHVRHDTGTACQGHEFRLEADQTARRNQVFQTHTTVAIRLHILQVTATTPQFFHHCALVSVFHVDSQHFERLAFLAVDFTEHNTRLAHAHLKTFTSHVFQQDGQMQFTAA